MFATLCLAVAFPAAILRYPTTSADRIAFVHADQIWIAPKSGGTAERVTDTPGNKSCLHFRADGGTLAFTEDGDGNESVYTLRLSDHKLTRVTHQVYGAQLCGWTPDGNLLFMSSAFVPNYQGDWKQLFTVSASGGLPQALPLTEAADGAMSPDGKLVAFTEYANRLMCWKGNTGGMASDLWLLDRDTQKARKITDWKGTDTFPMWYGKRLFFVSDAGPDQRMNLWEIDPGSGRRTQLTHFADYDLDDPCIGPNDIVFQKGGALFSYQLSNGSCSQIGLSVPASSNPVEIDAGDAVASACPMDDGRIVVEAGGDLWVTDSAGKNPRNLTNSDSAAERYPAISPDGAEVAFVSDADGEYNLETLSLAGGERHRLTNRTSGFLSKPCWSPDSQKLAFSDNSGQLYVFFRAKGELVKADRDEWNRGLHPAWSPDSKWLVYSKTEPSTMQSIWLYDLDARRRIRLTSGMTKDDWPAFDRKGDYLFFVSGRDSRNRVFDTVEFDNFVYPTNEALLVIPLRRDLLMPWGPRAANRSAAGIDFEDIERRATMMNPSPVNVSDLNSTASSNLVYVDWAGSEPAIKMADFQQVRTTQRLERTILAGADSYALSPNGSKLLARRGGSYTLLDVENKETPSQSPDFKGLRKNVDEKKVWKQIFEDAWRFCRDYFYDKSLNGVDWNAVRGKYEPLAGVCSARSELDNLIGQMIGELHSSHCYLEAAPNQQRPDERTGTLGVDFELANGAYRIKKIYDSAPWDTMARSILRRAGLNIQEGDYLLAVNGKPIDVTQDPWAALKGTAQTPTRLTIGSQPALGAGTRDIIVAPYADDTYIRGRAWMEEKRSYVSQKSGGRIGYIYMPDTLNYGTDAFVRQFYSQFQKEALIIDDRWNGGGRTPDRFIEILQRRQVWHGVRQNTLAAPDYSNSGPKCMIINGAAKSGGDSLPALFRQAKLGKLVGTPTMGARGGAGGPEPPPFTDGSRILVPHVSSLDATGHWSVGDRGVLPDILVLPDPANGDPQLDAAIDLMMRALKAR